MLLRTPAGTFAHQSPVKRIAELSYLTHSLGDLKFKPFGVTPEPEVRHMLLEGKFDTLTP